jgi:uncharacterized protein YwqG
MSDVSAHDTAHLLPAEGTLYFFYDIWAGKWGFDPEDRGAWMVAFHQGDTSGLSRTDPPPSLVAIDAQIPMLRGGLYSTCRLIPHATLTLPDHYSEKGFPLATRLDAMRASEQAGAEEADGSDEEAEDEESIYADVLDEWRNMIPRPWHQMLGYPALVQSDMEVECQLASHGIYCGNLDWRDDPRTPALLPGAEDWLLLFQIATDREANLEWGDSARLFYWIQRQALAARDFTNVWFVYQTH